MPSCHRDARAMHLAILIRTRWPSGAGSGRMSRTRSTIRVKRQRRRGGRFLTALSNRSIPRGCCPKRSGNVVLRRREAHIFVSSRCGRERRAKQDRARNLFGVRLTVRSRSVGRKRTSEASGTFDPADMAMCGRIGGYRTHAKHDSREITRPARERFMARLLIKVDPDGSLPEDERNRRAEAAKRAYFSALARKSASARRRKTRS